MTDFLRRKADQKTYDLVEAIDRLAPSSAPTSSSSSDLVHLVGPIGGGNATQTVGNKLLAPLNDVNGHTWNVTNGVLTVNALAEGEDVYFLVVDA